MSITEALIKKINNGNNNTFRKLYGNDTTELKKHAKRYSDLFQQFEVVFATKPVEFFSSPGRTEIGGNHTDHNYGRVLAGAINLDNVAIVAKNNTESIRIESAG